jgi:putative membrane-bound dehydrogenase-like protein
MIRSLSLAMILLVITTGTRPAPVEAAYGEPVAAGIVPADASGRPLNLDFETGTLADWTAEGDAFRGQPVEGDTVSRRRGDMHSRHAGRFWVGTYERDGDRAQGTLTSVPFRLTRPFASFLIGGGAHDGTAAELMLKDTGKIIFSATGVDLEDMERVVADLSAYQGKEIMIRLIDREWVGWGHINFDDFRLHETRPDVPPRRRLSTRDVHQYAGLDPEEAARAMTVPAGFRVTLFAGEPDVVQPIAMAIDDRGRLWIAEAYSYPRHVRDDLARDRILIFEDTDGDGRFNTRKVFAERLNLVSGLAVGFGGVWVGAAPHLLFIPDNDGDDHPDGPPQALLDGWGQQDTHETLNTFTWGPDGWLYGCHGVFTHSLVGRPGAPRERRTPINAGVWRYHPTRHVFEVFAHGTSNPWGLDFDERGQMIITACVIPHLYHMVLGGRYERQAGPHFNPYTYDDIKTIADHRHYLGFNPHAANGRSDAAGGGHAHAGAMIYLGDSWPAEYRGSLFMNNIHGARINRDVFKPDGSGFIGSHAPDFLRANDMWSQIVHLEYGPDGGVYLIDWYDKNQCHHNEVDAHDRTNGRVFKVSYGDARRPGRDLARLSDQELVRMQAAPDEWHARHARRILQERGPSEKVVEMLRVLARETADQLIAQLRILWTRHAVGGLGDAAMVAEGLSHPAAIVRAWTIQLATEKGVPPATILDHFAELARNDPSPVVRLYLASAAQRLPAENCWDIVAGLIGHAEDVSDPNLPLMDWYAAEPLAAVDARRAARMASSSPIPTIREFMARRIGAIGTTESLAILIGEVARAGDSGLRNSLLTGIEEGLRGRRQVAMPSEWPVVFARLAADADSQVRSRAMSLSVRFGDPKARAALRSILADAGAGVESRREALAALLQVKDTTLPQQLHAMILDASLGGEAVRGLSAYDDPATPGILIQAYERLGRFERRDALNTMAARRAWARSLLAAVEAGKLPRADLTADIVRQMRNLRDAEVESRIKKVWGSVRETTADRTRNIARYKAMLTSKPSRPPDPSLGRAVFAKTCQQCHTLFGAGAQVGPDLTGSNRADLDYLLSNVLDPSALIGRDYLAHTVATEDGRVLTGIIRAEDKDTITLVTANETVTLPRSEVAERRPSELSMMPEDLWVPLSEHEVRSLVSYLASPAQVPLPTSDGEPKPK